MRNALLFSLMLACAQAGLAQLSGPLSGTLGPGEFHVVDTISVEPADSLTLMPGTTFSFDGPYPFDIRGVLLAEGTETDSIIFTSHIQDVRRRWRGLRFFAEGASTGSLVYCVIENAIWLGGMGGGVSCYESSPSFANTTIRGNTAPDGGGLYCWSVSSPTFENCAFVANIARQHGGGAYCAANSSPRFTGCLFSDNEARDYGGGVYCQNLSSPTFTNCVVTSNQAGSGSRDGGGGVYCASSSAIFLSCSISANRALGDFNFGGGVYVHGSSPTFINCCISDNTVSWYGGGVCCDESSANFTSCVLSGNFARTGGAVYSRPRSFPTFTSCIIRDNSTDVGGGGVFCHDDTSPTFTNCLIINNSGRSGGGGFFTYDCWPKFVNCIIVGNSANTGAGVHCMFSRPSFNSTIIAFSQGAGIYFLVGSQSQIEHCSIFGNSGGNLTFGYDDPGYGPPGIGNLTTTNANGDPCDRYYNIFLDPMFVDMAAGDYHLLTGSSCIAAGDPTDPPPTDIEGNSRPYPPGSFPDIGAYEHPDGGHPWVFDLVSPQWGDTCWTLDTTLIWHAAFNPELNEAFSYEVWLDTLPDLSTAWEVASDLLDTTFHLTGLSDDHAYYWTVHASDLNSAGTWAESPALFYTYFPEPLATFVLLEPEDGAELPRGEVRFCWQAADDPDPNDTIVYTLFLTTGDTSFSYPMGADTCGMLDVGSLLLDDSLAVEWWVEAHSAHPDFTIESASHFHFYPPERLPAQFALHQNWPNPFNLTTVIRYDVKQDGSVRLTIYNLLGRKVTTLVDRWHLGGSHRVSWNAADSPSGIYFCRMEAPGFVQTRKLVLVK